MIPTIKNTLAAPDAVSLRQIATRSFDQEYDFFIWKGVVYEPYFCHPLVEWSKTKYTATDLA